MKIAERFYIRLYASDVRLGEATKRTSSTCDFPLVTKQEVRKALKGIKIGQVAGDDGITMDPLKKGGDIVLEKLAARTSECLKTPKRAHSLKKKNATLF